MRSFRFYEEYFDALEGLPEFEHLNYLKGVIYYGLEGIVCDFKEPKTRAALRHAYRLIDAENEFSNQ